MTVKALFIDDDPRALAEFQRLAGTGRNGIEATMSGPDQAPAHLATGGFDVVITGAARPNDASVGIMRQLAISQPEVARLLVASDRAASRSGLAEQYLWRPFDAEKLRVAVLATTHLRGRVTAERLNELAGGSIKLPSLPDAYMKIQEELRGPEPSIGRVGELIKQDPAISVKVLQVVNSALYGLRNEVGDIVQATSLLGLNTITSLVLAVGVFKQAEGIDRRFVEELWNESLRVGSLAREIAVSAGMPRASIEESQLAGLLHDVGEIVLLQNWRNDFLAVDVANRDADERRRFGATHADLGGYLTAVWGLPSPVIRAVANHHQPSATRADTANATTAVHVARALVDAGADPATASFDMGHLEAVGCAAHVETWIQTAA